MVYSAMAHEFDTGEAIHSTAEYEEKESKWKGVSIILLAKTPNSHIFTCRDRGITRCLADIIFSFNITLTPIFPFYFAFWWIRVYVFVMCGFHFSLKVTKNIALE